MAADMVIVVICVSLGAHSFLVLSRLADLYLSLSRLFVSHARRSVLSFSLSFVFFPAGSGRSSLSAQLWLPHHHYSRPQLVLVTPYCTSLRSLLLFSLLWDQ
jgi:hypothetical protein